ncbi:MAG: hypothetical protein ACLP9K_05825 [Nitrososphaerales archaeon]
MSQQQQKQKVRCGKCGTELEKGVTECSYCHSQLCPAGHAHFCKNTSNCMWPDWHVCEVCLTTWAKKLPSYLPPRELPPPEPEFRAPWLPTAMSASARIDTIDEGGQ